MSEVVDLFYNEEFRHWLYWIIFMIGIMGLFGAWSGRSSLRDLYKVSTSKDVHYHYTNEEKEKKDE